ncbi:hypothetical protein [Pantoea sp. Fr+CA_20]|uniref:hypothetical protein n=1 Tax=Pantoea sp. Fr+CA_20 TaxID=2929506 RepID=UPI002118489F|nr:hypothetical protein [Pantoea sp. Fr+CA_20]
MKKTKSALFMVLLFSGFAGATSVGHLSFIQANAAHPQAQFLKVGDANGGSGNNTPGGRHGDGGKDGNCG